MKQTFKSGIPFGNIHEIIKVEINIAHKLNGVSPENLIVSERPYAALKAFSDMMSCTKFKGSEAISEEEYCQGLKIKRLNRRDKDIIEVG